MFGININLEIHSKSLELIDQTFKQYQNLMYNNQIIGNPIIHLYPTRDTIDENGNLNGYMDALFMNVHVFDPKNKIKYTFEDKDLIFGDNENISVSQIKIFKDGSTMIVLRGNYKIMNYNSLHLIKC